MGIGFRIKEARNSLNLTQEELAKKIGVTKGAVANYENDTSHPKEPIMYKLFDALQVDANYLYQDEMGSNYPMKVTYDEMEHIKKYRSLDPHGKEMVDFTLLKEWERSTSSVSDNVVKYNSAKAAHNDYENEPGELEKMQEDISNLKRPE